MIKREKVENLENLTDLEIKVLQELIDGLYAEEGFSDVTVEDIATETEISSKKIRGVVSSLIKKEYIWIDEDMLDSRGNPIIYLSDAHYNLHPSWQNYDENDNEMIETAEQEKKVEKQYRQMSFGRKDLNKIAAKYGIELVKGDGYFYWVALDDVHFEEVSRKVNQALGQSVMIYAFSHCNKAFWVNELNCFVKDACLKEYHTVKQIDQHGQVRIHTMYVVDEVLYWVSNDAVVPPWCEKDCDIQFINKEKQLAAREAEVERTTAEYRKHREENGYSPEEIAEMRAAFGEGVEVGDALTGETFTL